MNNKQNKRTFVPLDQRARQRARLHDAVLAMILASGWCGLLWWYVIKLADSV